MKELLKSILKKSSIIVLDPVIGNEKPTIGNHTITINNACETVFEGSYRIPLNRTATVTGTLNRGFFGGGSGNIIGQITNRPPGIYPFIVDLGNSGIPGLGSTFTLRVTLDNGNQAIRLFQRTAFHSSLYDTQPC